MTATLKENLGSALKAAGWSISTGEAPADFWIKKSGKRYPVSFRFARDARRGVLLPLLADAILRGRSWVGGRFVAVVGASSISPEMARSLEQYVSEVAPNQPFGYVDERGLVRFYGLQLESARSEPSALALRRQSHGVLRDLFSDLNQWLLKILVGRKIVPGMLNIPREPATTALELAIRGRVSHPAAWRLLNALRESGLVDASLQLSLVRELLVRWRGAAQRPQRRLGAKWIFPGKRPVERLCESLAKLHKRSNEQPACLGYFAACDALGVGHVQGAPVHLYVRHLAPELLEKLGLVLAAKNQHPDLFLQVARWPESVFRAAVEVHGVPVTDILQCWLDVSSESTRGAEQAAFIWKRVLGPVIAHGEREP